jgi:hypothetical protein
MMWCDTPCCPSTNIEQAAQAKASSIPLGRRTYEMFEPSWSGRTVEDDPGAPFFNDTTKYVVSATLENPTWRNSQVIGGASHRWIRP